MYYALESAEVTAERRHNAMIYGAGVGVTVSTSHFGPQICQLSDGPY